MPPPPAYQILDGDLVPEGPALSARAHSLLWGNAVAEHMRSRGAAVPFFARHHARVAAALEALEATARDLPPAREVHAGIARMLNRNHLLGAAAVTLALFQDHAGGPWRYAVTARRLPGGDYALPPAGLLLDIYDRHPAPRGPLAALPATTAPLRDLALRRARLLGVDDCLMVNDQGAITQATGGALFALYGNSCRTPSEADGCPGGVTRGIAIALLKESGIDVDESQPLTAADLPRADELFLADDIHGIRHALGFQNHRYRTRVARALPDALNRAARQAMQAAPGGA